MEAAIVQEVQGSTNARQLSASQLAALDRIYSNGLENTPHVTPQERTKIICAEVCKLKEKIETEHNRLVALERRLENAFGTPDTISQNQRSNRNLIGHLKYQIRRGTKAIEVYEKDTEYYKVLLRKLGVETAEEHPRHGAEHMIRSEHIREEAQNREMISKSERTRPCNHLYLSRPQSCSIAAQGCLPLPGDGPKNPRVTNRWPRRQMKHSAHASHSVQTGAELDDSVSMNGSIPNSAVFSDNFAMDTTRDDVQITGSNLDGTMELKKQRLEVRLAIGKSTELEPKHEQEPQMHMHGTISTLRASSETPPNEAGQEQEDYQLRRTTHQTREMCEGYARMNFSSDQHYTNWLRALGVYNATPFTSQSVMSPELTNQSRGGWLDGMQAETECCDIQDAPENGNAEDNATENNPLPFPIPTYESVPDREAWLRNYSDSQRAENPVIRPTRLLPQVTFVDPRAFARQSKSANSSLSPETIVKHDATGEGFEGHQHRSLFQDTSKDHP